MSYELPFIPDKELACELQKKNPLPFDHLFLYNDDLHKYAIVSKDPEGKTIYIHKHVYGATTLIKKYKSDFDQYGGPNMGTRGKFLRAYNNWLPNGDIDVDYWTADYQDYIPLELWDLMRKCLSITFVENEPPLISINGNFTDLMRDHFRNPALFRVLTEDTPANDKFSDELIAKFLAWESVGRDPDQYLSIIGIDDALKCICFPPYVYPTDIVHFWDGATVLGTELHRRIELYYNGHVLNDSRELKDPAWRYFLNFVKDHNFNVIRTELNVGYPELHLCGQIDALALAPDGQSLIMIDWKRSKKLKEYLELDLDYAKSKNKYMKSPWGHLNDVARSHYTIQQNIYVWFFYVMVSVVNAIDHPIANLKFSKIYLLMLHPLNKNYILLSLDIFEKENEKTKRSYDAMLAMFEERRKEIEVKLSEDAFVQDMSIESFVEKQLSEEEQRVTEEEQQVTELPHKIMIWSDLYTPVESAAAKEKNSMETTWGDMVDNEISSVKRQKMLT